MADSDDDDVPQLSQNAMAALQEFYAERTSSQQATEEVSSPVIEENWVSTAENNFKTAG